MRASVLLRLLLGLPKSLGSRQNTRCIWRYLALPFVVEATANNDTLQPLFGAIRSSQTDTACVCCAKYLTFYGGETYASRPLWPIWSTKLSPTARLWAANPWLWSTAQLRSTAATATGVS